MEERKVKPSNYSHVYIVDEEGKIYDAKHNEIRTFVNARGELVYWQEHFSSSPQDEHPRPVKQLVYQAWHPNDWWKANFIGHKDGNKTNCAPDNLIGFQTRKEYNAYFKARKETTP